MVQLCETDEERKKRKKERDMKKKGPDP